jgi:hypothetical protein
MCDERRCGSVFGHVKSMMMEKGVCDEDRGNVATAIFRTPSISPQPICSTSRSHDELGGMVVWGR